MMGTLSGMFPAAVPNFGSGPSCQAICCWDESDHLLKVATPQLCREGFVRCVTTWCLGAEVHI